MKKNVSYLAHKLTERERAAHITDWLIIHHHPWHKFMRWTEMCSLISILQLKLHINLHSLSFVREWTIKGFLKSKGRNNSHKILRCNISSEHQLWPNYIFTPQKQTTLSPYPPLLHSLILSSLNISFSLQGFHSFSLVIIFGRKPH